MNLLLPFPPTFVPPPSILPVTHSLSLPPPLPRSQPLITVIGGFEEIRQRNRKKEGKEERRLRERRERFLEVRGPALFQSASTECMCVFFSIFLFLNQEAYICFGLSLKMQGSFSASKLARFSSIISNL